MEEYEYAGGDDAFKRNLAAGLDGVSEDQIEVLSVVEGSVMIAYSLTPLEGQSVEELRNEQNVVVSNGAIDFGAPVLDFSAGGDTVVEAGAVVLEGLESYGQVITPTPENSAAELASVGTEEIEAFLCQHYAVTLHQELFENELQSATFSCELVTKGDDSYRLHHFLAPEDLETLATLVFNRA